MKKLVIFFVFAIVSVSFSQTAAPKLFVKADNHDFGTIAEGEIVTHNFEIQNTGKAELKISQVHASCG